MKTATTVLSAAVLFLTGVQAAAQQYNEIPAVQPKTSIRPTLTVRLYPEGQAAGKGIWENGVKITEGPVVDNELRGPETCSESGARKNVGDEARIDIYLPKHCNGIMILETPGGGYSHLSTFNEGAYGADLFTAKGFAYCVLKYRLPNRHPQVPITDVHNAMRYLRHHAAEWGVEKIGVMGGSAGGHLSSSAAVMWTDAITRPDFAVLLYPRITLYKDEQTSTRDNLIGTPEQWSKNMKEYEKLLTYWSPDTHINKQTPPVFIVLSANDNSVNALNYLPYYKALIENEIPVEVHVYPTGGHGWGFNAEKFKGAGKDKFAAYRKSFEDNVIRWMLSQLY